MDISTKSLQELKAMAFDVLVAQDRLNKDLQTINLAIQKKLEEEKLEEKKDERPNN